VKRFLIVISALLAISSGPSYGTTLVLKGDIHDEVEVTHSRSFKPVDGRIDSLLFRFYNPTDFKSGALNQRISVRRVSYSPEPESVQTERDSFGNSFTVVTWKDLEKEATVTETYTVSLSISLNEARSLVPFPLNPGDIPPPAARFLRTSALVEANDAEIKKLASSITTGARSEQAAVDAILNWVVDNVKYRSPVNDYGAVSTLLSKEGNCQNFSHLSIALLRSIGIPARIAGGVSLGRPWKVPVEGGHLIQSIGQGGHAWMEVWYPDLGWAPYDAQQSRLFVGPRHIRQTAGMDSKDINDSWRASPKLPRFSENISAEYVIDNIALSLKETGNAPSSYVMASSLPEQRTALAPPFAQAEPPGLLPKGGIVEFGNIMFAPLTDFYTDIKADSGQRTFDKETSEYVTGEHTFAQAFVVDAPMRMEAVSLAMHKFGGRLGSLWIDVVNDAGGRPGMEGIRSLPLMLDTIAYHPGYKWFDFRFQDFTDEGESLKPGKYWIILRKSRDAVVSWAYTPGNRFGGPDDARSTEAGIDWPNIMNYDFNFKVTGSMEGG